MLRALSVLQALNRHSRATVVDLNKITGISRPSLYRLMRTLCVAGYAKLADDHSYSLTFLVRSLSDGFRDEEWVRECGTDAVHQLGRDLIWPVDLATFLNFSMYLRETSRPTSPLTIDRATIGHRLPMLSTALGRAYLAYCPSKERQTILEYLSKSRDPSNRLARNPEALSKLLLETLRAGYASRFREIVAETGSIAIPIMHRGRVLACLGMTFIASALSPVEAADRYLSNLQDAKKTIENALQRTSSNTDCSSSK